MKTATTTIQVPKQLKEKLDSLKQHPRETYGEVIEMLFNLVPTGDEEGEYTDEFRLAWLRGELDLLAGRTVSMAEAKKRLGL